LPLSIALFLIFPLYDCNVRAIFGSLSAIIRAANGSNEIIQSIFLAFGANGALGFEPSYSVHKIISQITNTNWRVVARNKDF
jgi:histidinol-phosphate/aromatic aminotransferase/cobyric acid decarboxylase-like protein